MMFRFFFRFADRRFRRYFETQRAAKFITAALFALVFVGIAAGVYAFFLRGFLFILRDVFFYQATVLFLYEEFFLFVAFLIFFGGLIMALFSLFRGDHDLWVLASPSFRAVGWWGFSRALAAALWPLSVIVMPALLAMRAALGLSGFGVAAAMLIVLGLAAFAIALSFIVVLAVVEVLLLLERLTGARCVRFSLVAFAVVMVAGGALWYAHEYASMRDLVALFQADDLAAGAAALDGIVAKFRALPSHYAAFSVVALQRSAWAEAAQEAAKLFGGAIVALAMLPILFRRHLLMWQALQEGSVVPRGDTKKAAFGGAILRKPFPRFLKGPVGALLEKEALVAFRTGRNMLWFLFLLALWLIQSVLANIVGKNAMRYAAYREAAPAVIQALQIVILVYFISAFVLRFVFPSFSAERRSMWAVLSAPVDLAKVFWAKLGFFLAVFLAVGVVLGLSNIALLRFPIETAAVLFLIFLTAIMCMTSLGLALGAMFPNFETDDPQVLSTSLPGLAFIAIALIYGGAGALALYLYVLAGPTLPVAVFEGGSLALIAVSLFAAPHSLCKKEFIKIHRS